MIAILSALAGWKLRAAVIGAAALVFVSWRVYDIQHQRAVGAQKFAAKIEKATNAKIEKAKAARRSVDGIPDERLRDQFFRD